MLKRRLNELVNDQVCDLLHGLESACPKGQDTAPRYAWLEANDRFRT